MGILQKQGRIEGGRGTSEKGTSPAGTLGEDQCRPLAAEKGAGHLKAVGGYSILMPLGLHALWRKRSEYSFYWKTW